MPRFIPVLVLALAIVGTRVPKPVEPIRGDGGWFVDATREHLELRYGSSDDGDWDDWILVALVGKLRTRARTRRGAHQRAGGALQHSGPFPRSAERCPRNLPQRGTIASARTAARVVPMLRANGS